MGKMIPKRKSATCQDDQGMCTVKEECVYNGAYNCACKKGYELVNSSCEDIDECSYGIHACHPSADCTNINGSYYCTCKQGMELNGIKCEDVNECTRGAHNCDRNSICTNFVQFTDPHLSGFAGYTCECVDGFVGNGFICMIESDGIASRTLVADSSSAKCTDSVLNRLSLFLVADDQKLRQTKRMSKVSDRLVQLIGGICSDLTSKGTIRQCADRTYPSAIVLKEFTKLPSISVWLDEVEILLERRLNNCKSHKKLKRRLTISKRHVRNILA